MLMEVTSQLPMLWVLVTGSRTWADRTAVSTGIEAVAADYPDFVPVIVHGMCDPRHPSGAFIRWDLADTRLPGPEREKLYGADWHAHLAAVEHVGLWAEHGMPAGWGDPCRDTCKPRHRLMRGSGDYCPAAGMYRNEDMIRWVLSQEGPKVCLPFINPCADPRCHRTGPHGSHGASGCADLAARRGLPVRWP